VLVPLSGERSIGLEAHHSLGCARSLDDSDHLTHDRTN